MDKFLELASSQLGLSPDASRSATSGLLGFLQKESGGNEFSALMDRLPGASSLAGEASGGGGGALGAMGGLLGDKLGGGLGDKLGSSLGLLGVLQQAGLDSDGAGKFVGMFFEFAKDNAGSKVVDAVLGQIPELRKLLG